MHDYEDTPRMRILELETEVKRLERELARGESRYANESVRRLRDEGFCPTCGAEEGTGRGRW
jgi:hypothetical protein